MATAMAELTQQNQELTREVNRQCQQHGGERGQNSGYEGVENNAKRDQSRGRHPKGTTFGKRDGPDEESYGRNEGFHEKSKPCG